MDPKIYLAGMSSTFKRFRDKRGYFEKEPRIGRLLTILNSETLAEDCELVAVEWLYVEEWTKYSPGYS